MTEVIINKSINVSADKAWKALSSFSGIENYSPIERSITEGNKRTCYMTDGAAIHEELNFANDATKEMQYKIIEGPFPVTGYVSDIKISQVGSDSCKITWSCEFQSSEEIKDEMQKLFGGFYEVIIDNLEDYLNK